MNGVLDHIGTASPVEISVRTPLPRSIDPRVVQDGIAIIRGTLSGAGFTGLFAVKPVVQVRSRSPKRLRVCRSAQGFLIVKVKPGDNGTAWEWAIYPPVGLAADHVLELLRSRVGSDEDDKIVEHAKPRFAQTDQGGGAGGGSLAGPLAAAIATAKPAGGTALIPAGPPQVPPAATPGAQAPAGSTAIDQLVNVFGNLQAAAQRYLQREAAIADQVKTVEAQEAAWTECAAKLDQLRAEHAADKDGVEALATLTTFKKALGA